MKFTTKEVALIILGLKDYKETELREAAKFIGNSNEDIKFRTLCKNNAAEADNLIKKLHDNLLDIAERN